MNPADAFLDAILENPADDLPRLVYADWLEENGQATYAEFIRLDVTLEHRETMPPEQRQSLRRRRHQLRRQLSDEWRPILGDGVTVMGTGRRGLFGESLAIDAADFVNNSPAWWPRVLARRLVVLQTRGWERELAAATHLSRVVTLEIGHLTRWHEDYVSDEVSNAMLVHLARTEQMSRLEGLFVGPVRATRGALLALAGAPFLPRLGDNGLSLRIVFPGDDSDDYVELKPNGPPRPASEMIYHFLDEYGRYLTAD